MKPYLLDPPSIEFLEELRERARRHGWMGDYIEIGRFVRELYAIADIPLPVMSPYEICKACDNVEPECTCK